MLNLMYRLIDIFIPLITFCASIVLFEIKPFEQSYLNLVILVSVLMLLTNELRGAYSESNSNRTLSRQLELTFESWSFVSVVAIVYLYLIGESHLISRKTFFVWFVLAPLFIVVIDRLVTKILLKRAESVNLLCVGRPIELTEYERKRIADSNIKLYCAESISSLLIPDNIDSIIFNYDIPPSIEEIKELTHLELSGVKTISANEFYEKYLRKCYVPYNILNIEFMNDIRKLRKTSLLLKKIVDISFSFFLLLITMPILIFSVLRIKYESPGDILFKQKRVGFMMKSFVVIKFRSMYENSEFNPYTKQKDDRIFPYGRFMRKMRIDELPQLFNVMRGDMHFIGPRAEWTILVENYEKEIPYYHERHLVRPGITGWAQVMYPYGSNTEDARQKLMYDLYYIKHWNFWLEVETIIRTIWVVLGRKGV